MITGNEALKFIEESNGRIFSVRFFKRGTTELREMVCRTGVKKHLAGGERAYEPSDYCLVYVYEMNTGYRCFPLDGLKEIKIDGKWQSVGPQENQT